MLLKHRLPTFTLNYIHLSLFTLLLIQAHTFSIVGLWKMTDISQISIPNTTQPIMNITQFVFRNQSIRYILEIESCGKVKYMVDVEGNAIQVDLKTEQMEVLQANNNSTNNVTAQNCQSNQSLQLSTIRQNLRKSFTFQLIYNFMIFSDAKGQIAMKFTRIFNPSPNIIGSWLVNWIEGKGIGETISIYENVIRLCGGNAAYKLGNRQINLERIIDNEGSGQCNDFDIKNSFTNSKYFVRRDSTLQFYTSSDNLTMSLNIISIANESQTSPTIPIPNPNPPQNTIQTIIPLDFTKISSLVGKWLISSVFRVPSILKTVQLIISPNTIILSAPCSTVIMPFAIDITNPLRINRNTMQFVQGNCVQEDEGLYRTAMGKMKDFKGKIEGSNYVIEVGDGTGEIVFRLERNVQYRIENQIGGEGNNIKPEQNNNNLTIVNTPVIATPPVPPVNIVLNPPVSIQNGKYVILLLKRRDLVRKIVTIENYKFSIEICNKLQIIIEQKSSQQAILKYTKQTNKQCSTTDEQTWISFFNSVRKYRKQGSNIYLTSDDNTDIITMSFLG